MGLSSSLIAQFVKATNDTTKDKTESTVYGTIVEQDGTKYVQLDGSDRLTPIATTMSVADGERVSVMIKNHTATVTGNLSSPGARFKDIEGVNDETITEFEIIVAGKVDTKDLNVEKGRIDELIAADVLIKETLVANEADIGKLQASTLSISEKLTAAEADISTLQTEKLDVKIAEAQFATIANLDATNVKVNNLESTYASFATTTTGRLNAVEADITDLEAKKLSAEQAELTYANIDFSNITKAAMEYFYATSGLIENVVVGNGTIAGKLIGVTISGDLIEGNTVVAEKLVIKGEDGLYYKLNTDGVTTEAEQTDYNSLNGSVIKAKSITAEKIRVTDLVAFGATIGGINIADGCLYTGAKSGVANTAIGVYLDKHGQMAIGDANNFIKYYTDSSGNRRLDISADSLTFGSSKKSVESAFSEADSKANTINAKIGEGGNLLLNGTPSSASNWGLNHNVTYVNGYFSVPAFTPSTEGGHGDTISQGFADRIPFASYERKFKITFDARDTSDGNQTGHIAMWMRWKKEDGSQNWPAFDLELSKLTSSWVSYGGYITIPSECKVDAFGIGLYTTSAFDIRSLFLEEATDLFNTQKDVTNAQNTAEDAQERVSEAEALIKILSDNISMLVTDGNGTSLMTQTADGWVFSTATMQDLANRTSEGLNDLTNEVNDVNNAVDILKQAVSDLGTIAEYIKIGTYEDEPCIELGEGDSDFKLIITNTRIMFMEGTGMPAYINNQSLNIRKAVVEEELQQGNFVWKIRSNGNLGLTWKGGTS